MPTTLTDLELLWIIAGAALVVVLLAVILLRRRRQSVRFDATAAVPPPPPRPATPRPAPPPAVPPPPVVADPPPVVADPIVAPSPVAAPPPAAAAELVRLKGLGPKAASRLAELGVSGIADLAALGPDDALRIDDQLGAFRGRLTRDRWVEQAQMLNAGEIERYEATFGKLGGGALPG